MRNANDKSSIMLFACQALHPVGDRDVDSQLQLDVVENKRWTQRVDTFLGWQFKVSRDSKSNWVGFFPEAHRVSSQHVCISQIRGLYYGISGIHEFRKQKLMSARWIRSWPPTRTPKSGCPLPPAICFFFVWLLVWAGYLRAENCHVLAHPTSHVCRFTTSLLGSLVQTRKRSQTQALKRSLISLEFTLHNACCTPTRWSHPIHFGEP